MGMAQAQEGPDDESAAAEPDCVAYWYSCRPHAEPATPPVHEGSAAVAGAGTCAACPMHACSAMSRHTLVTLSRLVSL